MYDWHPYYEPFVLIEKIDRLVLCFDVPYLAACIGNAACAVPNYQPSA